MTWLGKLLRLCLALLFGWISLEVRRERRRIAAAMAQERRAAEMIRASEERARREASGTIITIVPNRAVATDTYLQALENELLRAAREPRS